jgi:hypothetical protein
MTASNKVKVFDMLKEIDFLVSGMMRSLDFQNEELLAFHLSKLGGAINLLEEVLEKFEGNDYQDYENGNIIYSSKVNDDYKL